MGDISCFLLVVCILGGTDIVQEMLEEHQEKEKKSQLIQVYPIPWPFGPWGFDEDAHLLSDFLRIPNM